MPSKRKAAELLAAARKDSMEAELSKAGGEAAKWKRKHKVAVAEAVNAQETADFLLGLDSKPNLRLCKRVQGKAGETEGVAVVVPATDWHVEENVSLESTSGKNFFNVAEAEVRIDRFYNKVLRLIRWQNSLAPVTEIWHPLLGDLISGYIHEELAESNELSPTEACIFLQDMLCSGIDLWLKKTKLPIFVPTCNGNHGRTTTKKRIKTGYKNSFEWMLYMTLAKYYAKNKRVQWMVGKGYHNTQEIMGRRVRFHHGDGLRYQGGVGGITIPVNKSIAQWDKVQAVDFDIFGHWHTHMVSYPKWISCGSLMGYSEYSVEIKAEFQHPTQTFIVIDRRYGMTVALPIFVTKAKEKER